jgi:hypothetical protein
VDGCDATEQPMIDRTIATCPTPPKVTRYTTTRPVRVAYNYACDPLFQINEQWLDDGKGSEPDKAGAYRWVRSTEAQEYCRALGLETAIMAYGGTENRALRWHDGQNFKSPVPTLNRWDLDDRGDGNLSDPLDPRAAHAIAALAKDATRFGAAVNPVQPLILDVEGTMAYNGPTDTIAQVAERIANWTARLTAYRAALGTTDYELYAYFFYGFAQFRQRFGDAFTPELAAADQAMMRLLSGFNAGLYSWDQTFASPGSWFKQVDEAQAIVFEHYPFLSRNRWATISPYYQTFKAPPAPGTPVPLELWQAQVRYLVDRGWHLLLWMSGPLKPIKGHLDHLTKYSMGI